MPIAMRLMRMGTIHHPVYRISVGDSRRTPRAKFLEHIGTYNPHLDKMGNKQLRLNVARAKYWIAMGAQPSPMVARLLSRFHLLPVPPQKGNMVVTGPLLHKVLAGEDIRSLFQPAPSEAERDEEETELGQGLGPNALSAMKDPNPGASHWVGRALALAGDAGGMADWAPKKGQPLPIGDLAPPPSNSRANRRFRELTPERVAQLGAQAPWKLQAFPFDPTPTEATMQAWAQVQRFHQRGKLKSVPGTPLSFYDLPLPTEAEAKAAAAEAARERAEEAARTPEERAAALAERKQERQRIREEVKSLQKEQSEIWTEMRADRSQKRWQEKLRERLEKKFPSLRDPVALLKEQAELESFFSDRATRENEYSPAADDVDLLLEPEADGAPNRRFIAPAATWDGEATQDSIGANAEIEAAEAARSYEAKKYGIQPEDHFYDSNPRPGESAAAFRRRLKNQQAEEEDEDAETLNEGAEFEEADEDDGLNAKKRRGLEEELEEEDDEAGEGEDEDEDEEDLQARRRPSKQQQQRTRRGIQEEDEEFDEEDFDDDWDHEEEEEADRPPSGDGRR